MNTDTCLIPLTQGKFSTVSTEDYEYLSQFKWFAQKVPRSYGFYWCAIRAFRVINDPKQYHISMHRVVAKLADMIDILL